MAFCFDSCEGVDAFLVYDLREGVLGLVEQVVVVGDEDEVEADGCCKQCEEEDNFEVDEAVVGDAWHFGLSRRLLFLVFCGEHGAVDCSLLAVFVLVACEEVIELQIIDGVFLPELIVEV